MASDIPIPGTPVRGSSTGRPVMALFDLLGRTWAMGIVWQLAGGPHTFRSLRAACDGVSPSVLNRRLKELRATGLVELGDDGYSLTALGRELSQHLERLGGWSKEWARQISDWSEAGEV